MSTEQRKEALVSFINAVLTNNINRICIFSCQKFCPWTPVHIFVLKKKFEANLLHIERTGIWAGKRVTQEKNLSEQRSTVFFFRSKAGHSKQRREPTNWPYIWSRVPNQTWATFVLGLYRVPKLFGRISSDIIVSSKGRRLGARNWAVILVFIPFTTYENISFLELAGLSFTNGFSRLSRNGTQDTKYLLLFSQFSASSF